MTLSELQTIAAEVFAREPERPARYTGEQMIERAASVRRALIAAGASDDDLRRFLACWLHRLDEPDGQTTTSDRTIAIRCAALGFGLEMRLLGDGRCLFTPFTVH